MKAYNIQWDVDDDDDVSLPNEIQIPTEIAKEGGDAISDYLSDLTGYCHYGFMLES